MKVEISKEQKEALGEKIGLCVAFLKNEVQPHIVKTDAIEVAMGDVLDLHITSSKIFVTEAKAVIPGIDFYTKRTLLLENLGRKDAKKYICEAAPVLAVEFLKNWEKAKIFLNSQLSNKKKQVEDLNRFVEDFRL